MGVSSDLACNVFSSDFGATELDKSGFDSGFVSNLGDAFGFDWIGFTSAGLTRFNGVVGKSWVQPFSEVPVNSGSSFILTSGVLDRVSTTSDGLVFIEPKENLLCIGFLLASLTCPVFNSSELWPEFIILLC